MIKPLLYANGGPIILVQLETEYGYYYACDFIYTAYLRDLAFENLGTDVVYYTADGAADSFVKCGKTEGVFTSVNFGARREPTDEAQIESWVSHSQKGCWS